MMASYWIAVLSLALEVSAAFHSNLNYASPSRRHLSLGIDLPKVAKRSSALRARSWDPEALKFTHGVASGDPLPNSVILWTRVSPTLKNDASNVTVEGNVPLYNHDTETYIKASSNPICVEYQVGTDKNFSSVVDKGTAYTTSDIDYTVKVCPKSLHSEILSFDSHLGRSKEFAAVHAILLSIQCLWLEQQESTWPHEIKSWAG